MDKSTLNEDDGGSDSDEISQSFICCVCRSLSSLTNHFFFFFLSLIASIFISQYQLYRIALIFFFLNFKKYKLLYCFVYTLLILIDCQIYFFRNPHVITNTFQKCETNWSINLDCYFFFFLK